MSPDNTPGKLGHENDPALLDAFGEFFHFDQIGRQWQCAIDRFARGAGEPDRM